MERRVRVGTFSLEPTVKGQTVHLIDFDGPNIRIWWMPGGDLCLAPQLGGRCSCGVSLSLSLGQIGGVCFFSAWLPTK
ncbi:uncharacterized protein ARMOST_07781 [Armillaria ostoyae]|uniref:Uncharacterized protein n=1 Tax=Armillaria ostoyae TaxID=47428 RepID=A0A284R6Q4_ARMOS|nr:uncharacterized protein ARMOST_07781 [Armillaria ostoyae]